MLESRHTIGYCSWCQHERVLCAVCDNNCCNGTYGPRAGKSISQIEIGDDGHCKSCREAYDHQDIHFKDPKTIKFAIDIRDFEKLKTRESMS